MTHQRTKSNHKKILNLNKISKLCKTKKEKKFKANFQGHIKRLRKGQIVKKISNQINLKMTS